MTFSYVSREGWGADYHTTPQLPRGYYTVGMQEKDEFFVHYHGGEPRYDRGVAMAREVESIHHRNGWSGVGYSWLVGQDGRTYEARGWDGVAVACPNHNRRGIHIYVAIGGNQEPTPEALLSVIAIRDEHRRRRAALGYGNPPCFVHGDKYATECAGPKLTPWVHAGMPAPEEDPFMAVDLDAFATKIRNSVLFSEVIQIIGREDKMSLATAARVTYNDVKELEVAVAALEQGQKDLTAAVAAIDSDVTLDLPTKEEYLAVAREEFKAKADKARVSFEDEAAPEPTA